MNGSYCLTDTRDEVKYVSYFNLEILCFKTFIYLQMIAFDYFTQKKEFSQGSIFETFHVIGVRTTTVLAAIEVKLFSN